MARTLIRAGGEENTRRAVGIASLAGTPALLADAYFAQAELATQKGDMAGALVIRLQDLDIRRNLLAADPRNASLRSNMALVSKRVGGLLISLGRLEEAYAYYAAALGIERAWVAAEPLSVEARTALSFSNSDIGFIRMQQGRMAEALAHYRETVTLREALFAADGKNYRTRVVLASACWRTGELLVKMKRTREAVPLLERAEALMTGPGTPAVETVLQREELATVRRTMGLALGLKGRALVEWARTEFARLALEAPGREDLRFRLLEIDRELRKR